MNKNTTFAGGVKVLTMIPWRRTDEAFKGTFYSYGLYEVLAGKDNFNVTHGGERFGTFSYFTDAEDAIRRHIELNHQKGKYN